MTSRSPGDVGGLLEHAEWVRVLATRLVRDDADDAVQELWLSTLRSPPDPTRPARPWLARVLVNAARKRFRDETTRAAQEASAPVAEQADPEALVGRVQVQQRLVQQVLELDEPFRQTVLLRFFEGLSSAEIAERLNVPAGTVRWRLKEALDRLRAALDAGHGGARESWRLAVAPLVLPSAGPWLTAGVALMDKKLRLAVVAACLLFLGMLGWSLPGSLSAGDDAPRRVEPAPTGGVATAATTRPGLVRSTPAVKVESPSSVTTAAPSAAQAPSLPTPPAPSEPAVERAAQDRGAAPPAGPTDAGTRFAIDREGIRSAMRSAIPEVKDCYESWLAMHPGLGGKLVVAFTIDTDDGVEGRVTRISVGDGGIGHVPLEGCILSSVSDLRFDPPLSGPINVNYPLLLSATDGGRP